MRNDLLSRPRIIQPDDFKEGEQENGKNWLAQSIGNVQLGMRHARPFTANSTHANSQQNKRLSFYRKFVNKSVNEERKIIQQPKQQHRESMFLPYEFKIINQEESSQRGKNHIGLGSSNDCNAKNKSFEGFLQSKRRKDSLRKRQEGSQTIHRQKVVTNMRLGQTQREERQLNLSGRTIIKQKLQKGGQNFFKNGKNGSNPEKPTITRPEYCFTPFSPSQRDSSIVAPFASFNSKQSKLSTIHSQAEKARTKFHYIRYTFQQDQGYALFNKTPFSQPQQKKKANPSNRRKLLLFNPKPPKQPQPSALQPSILRIQGWQAPAQEEELLPK